MIRCQSAQFRIYRQYTFLRRSILGRYLRPRFPNRIPAKRANIDPPIKGATLDFVLGKARKALPECALINVRGLGGGNGSMAVERLRPD